MVFAPLLLLIFWMGVAPQPFLDRMQPTLDRTIQMTQTRARQLSAWAAAEAGTTAPAATATPATPGATRPETEAHR